VLEERNPARERALDRTSRRPGVSLWLGAQPASCSRLIASYQ
jgi:hypothetical protein